MTPEQFVEALRNLALMSAVRTTTEILEKGPPGRKPHKEHVELSAWYQSLSAADRGFLVRTLKVVAHNAVFSVLAVLDNVRAVEASPDRGEFVLVYRKNGMDSVITDPDGELLHDILNTQVI